jgi:predicted phosphohydrolase
MSEYTLRIFSDIHYDKYPDIQDLFEKLDFYYPNVNKEKEILILAGDIGIATEINELGKLCIRPGYTQVLKYLKSRWNRVILVPGNHEYYTSKGSVVDVNNLISNECEKFMIDFLNKDVLELNGYVFLGCTLWSHTKKEVFDELNPKNWSFIDYEGLITLHNTHKQWLENNLEKYKIRNEQNKESLKGKVIVITHYLPTSKLLHPKYTRGDYAKNQSAYVSNLDDMIRNYNFLIPIWICGHSHMTRYSRIGKTLLFNCPVGNPWEEDNYIFQDTIDL